MPHLQRRPAPHSCYGMITPATEPDHQSPACHTPLVPFLPRSARECYRWQGPRRRAMRAGIPSSCIPYELHRTDRPALHRAHYVSRFLFVLCLWFSPPLLSELTHRAARLPQVLTEQLEDLERSGRAGSHLWTMVKNRLDQLRGHQHQAVPSSGRRLCADFDVPLSSRVSSRHSRDAHSRTHTPFRPRLPALCLTA